MGMSAQFFKRIAFGVVMLFGGVLILLFSAPNAHAAGGSSVPSSLPCDVCRFQRDSNGNPVDCSESCKTSQTQTQQAQQVDDTGGTASSSECARCVGMDCQAKCKGVSTDGYSSSKSIDPNCTSKLADLMKSCADTTSSAKSSCDEGENQGLNQAKQSVVALGSQVSASIQGACSTMGKVSDGLNAATAAYQLDCSSAVATCTSSCATAVSYYRKNNGCSATNGWVAMDNTALDDQKTCTALIAQAKLATQAINNLLTSAMQSQSCSQLAAGLPDMCKTNPTLPGCPGVLSNVDCNNPTVASTNKICICSKTPNAPQCLQTASLNGGPTTGGGGGVTTTPSGNANGGLDDGTNFGLPPVAQAKPNPDPGGNALDGKQGGGANFGSDSGGGGGGGKSGAGGGGAGADPVAVTGGFYGSGGGGGGGFSSGSNGSGEGGRGYNGGGAGLQRNAQGGIPNLRQFLPGGKLDPSRGIAGVSGPDGITGPNSDIWLKIQNRYQVLSSSLMP